MAQLNKEFLQQKRDEVKYIHIDDFDLDCHIKKIPIKLILDMEKLSSDSKGKSSEINQMVDIVICCCVDEHGRALFDSKNDRDLILGQGHELVKALFFEIINFSNVTEGDVEDKAKN